MATTETTTLRMPRELRDVIARLAEARSTTMLDVVTEAVERLSRDQWWDEVHRAVESVPSDVLADVDAETTVLDDAAADGIDGD